LGEGGGFCGGLEEGRKGPKVVKRNTRSVLVHARESPKPEDKGKRKRKGLNHFAKAGTGGG